MEIVGKIVIYIIMASAIVGAIAAIRNDEEGIGKEFIQGLYSIGPIFVPVAGIMASVPYLSKFISSVFGPIFHGIGADPSIAATTFIAVDMGGYQLADALAQSRDSWIMAMVIGFMAGATIVFSIPVGLTMLEKRDHKYMALGVMSGILSVPIGVFISSIIMKLSSTNVREQVSTNAKSTYVFSPEFGTILLNLLPLIIVVILIALGLRFIPDKMIKGFMWFGKLMDIGIKLVLVFSIVEYFTGIFSTIFGAWGFDPIIADKADQFRALEVAGYIGVMLCGAFPMIYMIRKYLAKPLEVIGNKIGLSPEGSAGLLAASANILAMFNLIKHMRPKDKVICISFSVTSAFLFGDHLAFTANFQPNMILPVMIGKLSGGIIAIVLAYWISVPKALELEKQDRASGVIGKDEYQPKASDQ
ncbi:ethanolamine utilization protein EutH [Neobacillus dielmonensis]|uniref:ethanolamine utilization protein EutH n=1 Tax=Neobacillus dielmonensis TaxID=1347369 RepID=UPI0005AB1351|nr:ethanolamine utilization protein EutH [Neobacillus dielmonensis]